MDFTQDDDSNLERPFVNDKREELRTSALKVYNDVWNDFYWWEQRSSRAAIAALIPSGPDSRRNPPPIALSDCALSPRESNNGVDTAEVTQYDDHESVASIHQITIRGIHLNSCQPYPQYIFCTPLHKNVGPPAMPINVQARLEFMPYADEEHFLVEDYSKEFESFAWQTPSGMRDPDWDLVQYETARKLRHERNWSYDDIDAANVFPPLESVTGTGLIRHFLQRDKPSWPGAGSPDLSLPPVRSDFSARLHHSLAAFCGSAACAQPLCTSHRYLRGIGIREKKTKRSAEAINNMSGKPCGEHCFRIVSAKELSTWADDDVDDLRVLLKVDPDASICDLATLCRKPCREVYAHSLQLGLRHGAEETMDDEIRGRAKEPFELEVLTADAYVRAEPGRPCNHEGPCDNNKLACECVRRSMFCTRECACDKSCKRRWTGCKCRAHRKGRKLKFSMQEDIDPCLYGSAVCKCRIYKQECDPELCRSCRARGDAPGGCQNNVLLRGGLSEFMEVKRAEYGLGAFARRHIKCGQFIGEYVGEIFDTSDDDGRSFLRKYTGRNYTFDIFEGDEVGLLDSAFAGNSTRFLNHSAHPNVQADTELVDGLQRINLFAIKNIKAKQELFLDYGTGFFIT